VKKQQLYTNIIQINLFGGRSRKLVNDENLNHHLGKDLVYRHRIVSFLWHDIISRNHPILLRHNQESINFKNSKSQINSRNLHLMVFD